MLFSPLIAYTGPLIAYCLDSTPYSLVYWIQVRTFHFQRIIGRLALRHIDNTVHIEANLLRARWPRLVAEAVDMFAIIACIEGVINWWDGFIIYEVGVCWVLDL